MKSDYLNIRLCFSVTDQRIKPPNVCKEARDLLYLILSGAVCFEKVPEKKNTSNSFGDHTNKTFLYGIMLTLKTAGRPKQVELISHNKYFTDL